jgi:Protein of unknown function (DUF2510)
VNPGWYPDPNGGPELRWWDGSTWTEHTSPAPPGTPAPGPAPTDFPPPGPVPGPVGFPPAGPAPGLAGPPGSASGGHPPAPGGAGSKNAVLVGLAVLIVALLLVGGFVLLSGDDESTADPTTTTTAETDDTTTTTGGDETTTTTAPSPDSELISSGGLTFTRLPEPWQDWIADGQGEISELTGTAGQYVVVQEQSPSGGSWISNLLIGELTSSITYSGEADLPAAAQTLTDQLTANYYVDGAQATPVRSTEITIDGHPGYFIHTELTFSQEGLETTREKVVVVVVDTGRARPGVFWASIPYNSVELNEGMDAAYQSLTVND